MYLSDYLVNYVCLFEAVRFVINMSKIRNICDHMLIWSSHVKVLNAESYVFS